MGSLTPFLIREDGVSHPAVIALLQEHLDSMKTISPPESMHALDYKSLRAPEVTFWSAWEGSELLGCGALKELNVAAGEIKSMRTALAHRNKGVGSRILRHIMDVARARDYKTLSLETGSQPEFDAACALYARFGFQLCGPFGDYRQDPNSVFMTITL